MDHTSVNFAGMQEWRLLARWSLLAGLVLLGVLLAFGLLVLPASEGNPLSEQYIDLVAVTQSSALFRMMGTLDTATWLLEGGFLIAAAALFRQRAPMRSIFMAAGGIGQLAGFLGAFVHLDGVSHLAAQYGTAAACSAAAIIPQPPGRYGRALHCGRAAVVDRAAAYGHHNLVGASLSALADWPDRASGDASPHR